MKKFRRIRITAAFILVLFTTLKCFPCSTYKVTVNDATMYGMNYDTWFEHPRIWFETNGYGAVFTGANNLGAEGFTPQSGMNVYGLSFGTLATATPENGIPLTGKKQITSRANYLKDILHQCKTVEEVKAYIEQYDHSALATDVFLYTDKSGKYLIAEPYKLTIGNDNKYVLANFCPSTINDFSTIKQQRYINGTAFLKNKIDTSLAFCTALSDTMHVCRKKIGDGTLLTSIWDLNKGIVHLYFYHDYNHQVQFRLTDELSKGNHSIEIASLFPFNAEYNKLLGFKTPLNSPAVDWFLRSAIFLFLISGIYFLVSNFRNRKEKHSLYKLLLAFISLIMLYYMFALEREINIFYFPAPYQDYKFSMMNIAAYIPFLILLLIIPLLIMNRKIWIDKTWKGFSKWLFTINNISYLMLIGMFAYWGLYNVFG